MAKEIFNRYENKFLLNEEQYNNIKDTLNNYMILDAYNKNDTFYTITNTYYDTLNNDIIRHSLSKPKYKEKVRVRSYGVPKKDDFVFLEIKKKFNGLVNKRRTKLKLYEAEYFLSTGIIPPVKPYMNKQVLNELAYYVSKNEILPATYIAYDRIAYFAKDDDDLRVTFDTNIRTRRYDTSLDCGTHGKKLLDDGIFLMEVKSSKAIPLWLSNKMAEEKILPTSFSKYGTEYKNMLLEKQVKQHKYEAIPRYTEDDLLII